MNLRVPHRFVRILLGWTLLLPPSFASAHDFWIQPDTCAPHVGIATPMTLLVGHGPYRQRSPIQLRRILRFDAYGSRGARLDLKGGLRPGGASGDGAFSLPAPGPWVLALETDANAESHLPALRYNDYLKAEGLTPAIQRRQQMNQMDADGAENYRRVAKTILHVPGALDGTRSAVTQRIGLSLEIVPEHDPTDSESGRPLSARVFFEGRPLPGALVKLTDLAHDDHPVAMQRTDATGRVAFAAPAPGNWLLNVIWTKPAPPSRLTDFETTFSSLSFCIP